MSQPVPCCRSHSHALTSWVFIMFSTRTALFLLCKQHMDVIFNICGWAENCNDCSSHAIYSASSRSTYKDARLRMPRSDSTMREILTANNCAVGLSNRQKPLCCNTPGYLHLFLQVLFEHLIHSVSRSDDLLVFPQKSLSYTAALVGANRTTAASFLVIDGPMVLYRYFIAMLTM
ncbi:hypothetical protein BD289DRAFT_442215, partial [Coniella lustricola]